MGQAVVRAAHADPELTVVAALEAESHPNRGEDIGVLCGLGPIGVSVAADAPRGVECVIDFSVPEAALDIAKRCAVSETPLFVGTTGFTDAQRDELIALHHTTSLLVTSNASLVVAVLQKLARETARILRDKDFDVEIIEWHHRHKVDAPSGTALQFARIIEEEMALTNRRYGREGMVGERPRNELCVHSVRGGSNVGEHTVLFSTIGETLELVHRGHSRDSYVTGALAAAKYLATTKPGLYSMADVLGL